MAPSPPIVDEPILEPVGFVNPPRRSPVLTASSQAVRAENPKISEPAHILEYNELLDTEHYVGCLAYLDGRIGLSFLGLQSVVEMKIKGRSQPYEAQPGTFQPLTMSRAYESTIVKLLHIWNAWQMLLEFESNPGSSVQEVETMRAILNREYDDFTAKKGLLNSNQNVLKFDGAFDCRLGLLLALETFDKTSKQWFKAACFSERTRFPQQEVSGQFFFEDDLNLRLTNAYFRALNECNDVDLDRIAELSGVTTADAERTLVDIGLVFREPILPEGTGHRSNL